MNKPRRALLLALLLLCALSFSPARAQTTAHGALTMLPASDVVLVINHSRIWNEAVPRFFGDNAAPLAHIRAEMEKFKKMTGVDVRSVSQIVIGVRFVNAESVPKNFDKKEMAIVIIAQGDFSPAALVAAMKRDARERVQEEQHAGQTIYTINEPYKGGASPRPDIEKVAVAVLDGSTIAVGDLVNVRATVDARTGGARLSPDLAVLVMRNSNALISLAGNVPANLSASLAPKGSSGNADLDKTVNKFFETIASIRQMYLSTGLTPTGVETYLGARLGSAEQAASLSDMLLGARQQYSVFIEDKMVRDLVNSIQVKAEGDEIQFRGEVPQTLITAMLDKAKKDEAATTAAKTTAPVVAPAAQPQPKKKTGRSTRRKRG